MFFDYTQLADSNLLLPRKKPTGNVLLNDENRLSKGLLTYVIFNKNGGYDLVRKRNPLTDNTRITPINGNLGYNHTSGYQDNGWFDVTDYQNCTSAVGTIINSIPGTNHHFLSSRVSGTNTRFYIINVSGNLRFYLGSTFTQSTVTPDLNVFTLLTNQKEGTTGRGFINGVQTAPDTSVSLSGTGTNYLSVMAQPTLDNQTPDATLYFYMIWNRLVPSEELISLYSDPYQLLMPI